MSDVARVVPVTAHYMEYKQRDYMRLQAYEKSATWLHLDSGNNLAHICTTETSRALEEKFFEAITSEAIHCISKLGFLKP